MKYNLSKQRNHPRFGQRKRGSWEEPGDLTGVTSKSTVTWGRLYEVMQEEHLHCEIDESCFNSNSAGFFPVPASLLIVWLEQENTSVLLTTESSDQDSCLAYTCNRTVLILCYSIADNDLTLRSRWHLSFQASSPQSTTSLRAWVLKSDKNICSHISIWCYTLNSNIQKGPFT